MRGLEMTRDDLVRRSVIQALICLFELCKESLEQAWLLDFDRYFADELAELREFECEGLLEIEPEWISVTPRGRLLTSHAFRHLGLAEPARDPAQFGLFGSDSDD